MKGREIVRHGEKKVSRYCRKSELPVVGGQVQKQRRERSGGRILLCATGLRASHI